MTYIVNLARIATTIHKLRNSRRIYSASEEMSAISPRVDWFRAEPASHSRPEGAFLL